MQDTTAEADVFPNDGSPASQRVAFVRRSGRFIKLLMRGAGLELITFGFYRFWLATDIRRNLWSHTQLDGDPLEYTGRGRELLIGFLVALAILAPIYLAYILIGIELERLRAFASIPLVLFLFLFGQFAVYRARRYRLTRTVWRGVRFWMTGSAWNYAVRAALWDLVVVLTLGLAWPWRVASLERYKMRHTYYGNLQGRFEGRGLALFKRGWWIWAIALAGICMILSGSVIAAMSAANALPKDISNVFSVSERVAFLAIGGLAFVATPFLWPIFRAMEWRWWAKGLRIGAFEIDSDFGNGAILKIYLKLLLFYLLVTVVVGAIAFGIFLAFASGAGVSITNRTAAGQAALAAALRQHAVPLFGGVALLYIAAILTMGVINRFFLQHEMWRAVASSLSVRNLVAAGDVEAAGGPADAIGEGLLDGLDVAGF